MQSLLVKLENKQTNKQNFILLQIVVDIMPETSLTNPFPFPQIEFGNGTATPAAILDAPV